MIEKLLKKNEELFLFFCIPVAIFVRDKSPIYLLFNYFDT